MSRKPIEAVEYDRFEVLAKEDVAALRMMTRDERLALLMQSLDAACGPLPARKQAVAPSRAATLRQTLRKR